MAASTVTATKLIANQKNTLPTATAVAAEGSVYQCSVDPNGAEFLILEVSNGNDSAAKTASVLEGLSQPIGYHAALSESIAAGSSVCWCVAVGDFLRDGKVVVEGDSTDIQVKAYFPQNGRG